MENMEWDEELIFRPRKVEMELAEDVIVMMMKKQPMLQELIDHFDLEMEY